MSGFPIHFIGALRMCGALTTPGPNNPLSVFVGGKPVAVAGDLDSHNNLGALISLASGMSGGGITIAGAPLIASMIDQGSPDVQGIIPHVTGLPTPAEGFPTVSAYGMLGSIMGMMGGGQGGGSGPMQNGEQVTSGGHPVGDIYRYVNGGGAGFSILVLANTTNNIIAGSTVTGVTTGNTFTFSTYSSMTDPVVHTSSSNTSVSNTGANVFVTFSGYREFSVIVFQNVHRSANGQVVVSTPSNLYTVNLRANDYIRFESLYTGNTSVFKLDTVNQSTNTITFMDTGSIVRSNTDTLFIHISDKLGISDGYEDPINVRMISHIGDGQYFIYPQHEMKQTGYTDFTEVINGNTSLNPVSISVTHYGPTSLTDYGFIGIRTYDKDRYSHNFDAVKYKMT